MRIFHLQVYFAYMNQKCITVSIIGKPNAGKSTLLNKLIDKKISIVSPKVQTTRNIIKGIVTRNETQIIFIDTPGIFEARRALEKAMVRAAWSTISGTDMILLLIDARHHMDEIYETMLRRIMDHSVNITIVLTKIDLVCNDKNSKIKMATLKERLYSISSSINIFEISSLNGTGVQKLEQFLISNAKSEKWLYDKDDITDAPMRFLASEITREKLFLLLGEELPYNLTVDTETWEIGSNEEIKIRQVITVSKEGYKKIVIGKNGSMIKKIGTLARQDIDTSLEIKSHLFLFIRVRENWDIGIINKFSN